MSDNRHHDEMGLVYLGMVALAIGFTWFLWYSSHAEIAYYGLKWSWWQLAVFDWPFMPEAVRHWRAEAAHLAWRSGDVSFMQLMTVMNRAGAFFIGIPIALAIRGIVLSVRHKAQQTRRRVTIRTLPWIMSAHSPAIIPTLYYGDKDTLLLNVDPPEHRSAINPEEWVEEHGLLVNGELDRGRCRQLLTEHLGQKITSIHQLRPAERSMFAVFGARLFSAPTDRDQAQLLLDSLNRSCHEHSWEGKRGYPDLSLTDSLFARYAQHADVAAWIRKHPYPRTLLYSLHKAALAGGKLPPAHFRWLKGMDRLLWYALVTTGRKTPFLESAAVFAQAQWESFAFDCGYQLTEPCIDDAIDGIEAYLTKIGLIAKKTGRSDP